MAQIFLSYRRADSQGITDRIYDRLRHHFSAEEIFKDVNTIPAGEDFVNFTRAKLALAKVVLVIIGPDWLASFGQRDRDEDYVYQEVSDAITSGAKVVPVYVRGAKAPTVSELPRAIRGIGTSNGVQVRHDPDFDRDMERLVSVIESCVDKRVVLSSSVAAKSSATSSNSIPYLLVAGLAGVVAVLAFFLFRGNTAETSDQTSFQLTACDAHKVAVLIANFRGEGEDALAHAVAAAVDQQLVDSLFEVRPVGYQARSVERYRATIDNQYFNASCDTSGLFVNGVHDRDQRLFSLQANAFRLSFALPEFLQNGEASLVDPPEITFLIRDDAKFISDWLLAMLNVYSGDPEEAVDQLQRLATEEEIIQGDPQFLAYNQFYLGTAFAIRGDRARANAAYAKAATADNVELKRAATLNQVEARKIERVYRANPEYNRIRIRNIERHKSIEDEILALFRNVGKALNKLFKGFN